MAGVPASKRAGGGKKVEPSTETWSIISPPPCQGGIPSSTSPRPQRKPTPVGPHILCPDATKKSTPRRPTSTGMCGTDWHASSSTRAPTPCAAATISPTGATAPSTLETCCTATSLVRGPSSVRRCGRSSCSVAFRRAYRSTTPRSAASSCHGTMLEWCSATLSTTSSPSPRLARPHVCATRLIASVAPLVNTTSSRDAAPTKAATLSRAAS
mmetsp:Transcript_33484/g.107628  ORF Transcript_33484/g.107628 Transcript_33484/m.107628 type:complete len:212 (+) Transcript_33484:683-1318(+)